MKKMLCIVLSLVILLSLSACGGSSYKYGNTSSSPAISGDSYYEVGEYDAPMEGAAGELAVEPMAITDRKLIYTASVSAETKDLAAAKEAVDRMMSEFSAYVESSEVSGDSYESSYSRKYLRYTIRVPAENLQDLLDKLGEVVNVTNQSLDMDDVTNSYIDTDARLSSLKREEERLLELLDQAENLEEILQIEDRLSTVRYQIESMTSILQSYDRDVAYSTVKLHLYDVTEYSANTTFGSRFSEAFTEGWASFGRFLEGLLLFLVRALPFLLLIAVIVVVVLFLVKASTKRKKAKYPKPVPPMPPMPPQEPVNTPAEKK